MVTWWEASSAWWWSLFADKYGEQWISGITGAGGAILGGLVVLIVTATITAHDREKERKQKMAAAAFTALHKLTRIYSLSLQIRKHLQEGLQAAAQSPEQHKCTKVQPMQRLSGPVHFTPDELWSMIQFGGPELQNQVNSLDDTFNIILDSLDRFGVERQKAWDKQEPISAEGLIGTIEFDGPMPPKMRLEYAMLDTIVVSVNNMVCELVDDTFAAITMLVHAHSKPLGKKFKIGIPNPALEFVEIRAEDASKRKMRPDKA